MIDRYTRPEMGEIWNLESRFAKMLQVEKAVAKAQAEYKIIPEAAARAIQRKGKFSVAEILKIEKTTRHDVIAFVSCVAKNVGDHGRYVHYGMTSSDILDTALSLQIRESYKVLKGSISNFEKSLSRLVRRYKETLCSGRTHGMHAEPVSFGLKMAGFLAELKRNQKRIERAMDQLMIVKLSGAVGTYSAQSEKVEKRVGKLLKLTPETIATQVIPRDRHAELFSALAIFGGGLERLSVELRHLQRTEVNEVLEGFAKGQKGSSAMPHKKNPISAENITGVSRLLRGYALSALENIALWHERDISHSSVERVTFPDAMILADYAADRMARVLDALQVNKKRMIQNMDLSQGQLYSSHVLLSLVKKGLSREEAYKEVQRVSHSLKEGEQLKERLLKDKVVGPLLSKKEINEIFSGQKHKQSIKSVIRHVLR